MSSFFKPSLVQNLGAELFETPVKRGRDEVVVVRKRGKGSKGGVQQIYYFDEELEEMEAYRLYSEKEVAPRNSKIIRNECDDDCATDIEQVEFSIDYMAREVLAAIIEET